MDAFLAWFVVHRDQEEAQLKQRYGEACSQGRLDRLSLNLFCLRWAFDVFLRFALDVGAVDSNVLQHSISHFEHVLRNMEGHQQKLLASIQKNIPKSTIVELLWSGLQQKVFPLVRKARKLDSSHGLIRGNDLFLPPDLLLAFIHAQEGYQGISSNKLGRELRAAGLLVLHANDRANTIKMGKEGLRVYHICLDRLEKAAQGQSHI